MVVVTFCLATYSSENYYANQCNGQNQTNQSTKINNCPSLISDLGVWADRNHDAIEALSALGGVIFSFVLTASTILLWAETRRLARGADAQGEDMKSSIREAARAASAMEKTEMAASAQTAVLNQQTAILAQTLAETKISSITLNRAYIYVFIISENFERYLKGLASSLEITWQIKNFGQTPARLTSSGGRAFCKQIFSVESIPPEYFFGKIIIGKDESGDLRTISFVAKDADQLKRIIDGSEHIYVLIGCTYFDVFWQPHFTSWCARYDVTQNMLIQHGHGGAVYNGET